jgi:hypothetical protein
MLHPRAGAFMKRPLILLSGAILFLGALYAFQKPFRQYPGVEHVDDPLPRDYDERTEWVFARLMYPWNGWGFPWGGGGDWRLGSSNWTIDYPRSERHFLVAMRRLTRVHTRSVEQPVNLDDAEQYDWPFLYAVEVGHWQLSDEQAKGLREYLLRGGFFMVDDFHGEAEWGHFQRGMQRVFPDRKIVDIPDDDSIFHSVFNWTIAFRYPARSPSILPTASTKMAAAKPNGAASTTIMAG